ncbi:hypothetical protein C8R46DRAFT_878083 [Mycena filopes]|nr:hypothetical protein C8R46DRAFT_878083 [Mycena filopes]
MARNERGDSDGGESTHSESTETGPGNRVGYNNFAVNTWKARTNKSVRRWAEKYRTAPTQAEAQAHFNRSGVRWTEFLRLPYFDLPKMLVIDSMHNLFLGLLKEHFRNILGFRPTSSPPTPTPIDVLEINITPTALNPLPTKITELDSLRKALALLRQPMSAALKDPEESLKIPELPKFKQLHQPPSPEPLADDAIPGVEPITQTEKEALWADLARMVKPSWVTSVPPHFGGESSDGKLKADQWRTLATLYMPVTLIRLWAASGVNTERRALLDLTMDLVSAIIVASSRTTSLSHYQECEEYLLAYRTKLSKLFPDYKCHPNHHFAMHIPAFLLLFGPVHGWWTYPLERLIGKLQRVPTNYKPGERSGHPLTQGSDIPR